MRMSLRENFIIIRERLRSTASSAWEELIRHCRPKLPTKVLRLMLLNYSLEISLMLQKNSSMSSMTSRRSLAELSV